MPNVPHVAEIFVKTLPLRWPAGCLYQNRPGFRFEVAPAGIIFVIRNGYRRALAAHPNSDGYLSLLILVQPGVHKKLCVHQVVCTTFHGRRPTPNHEVRHKNGNRTDNRARNLAWGTSLDNARDRERHGRTARGLRNGAYTKPHMRRRGELNGNSKLTAKKVRRILRDRRSQSNVARSYGVTQALISHIKLGYVWSHVTGIHRG